MEPRVSSEPRVARRLISSGIFVLCGWLIAVVATALAHGLLARQLILTIPFALPFVPIAMLWLLWPNRAGFALGGLWTYLLGAWALARVDLGSDPQAGIALMIYLAPSVIGGVILYGVCLAAAPLYRQNSPADER